MSRNVLVLYRKTNISVPVCVTDICSEGKVENEVSEENMLKCMQYGSEEYWIFLNMLMPKRNRTFLFVCYVIVVC